MNKANFKNEDKKLDEVQQIERLETGNYGPRDKQVIKISEKLTDNSIIKEELSDTFINKID